MPRLSVQPIGVFSTVHGQDETGMLVLYDNRLAGVLVRLGSMHGDEEGFWNLEVGFGLCAGRPATFSGLAAALRWIGQRCLLKTDELENDIVELVQNR